jgi:PAS domain S-box-containing protein
MTIDNVTPHPLVQPSELDRRSHRMQYEALLNSVPIGIFRCDATGQITYVNEQTCQIMHLTADELMGTGWIQRLHPRNRDQALANWCEGIESGAPFIAEGEFLLPDGTSFWSDAQITIERDEVGNFAGYLGVVLDTTDRKRVEIALQSLVEGTASATGEAFFPVLVKQIAQALGVRHASISKLEGDKLRTLAFWSDHGWLANTSYSLASSPCGRTLKEEAFYCPKALRQMFPHHLDLVPLEAESYLGVAMKDAMGNPLGILSILDSRPIPNRQRFEDILRIFAARASAELERQQAIAALQQLNAELEQRVEDRTIELTHANHQLVEEIKEHHRTEAALSLQLKRLNQLYHLVLRINEAKTVDKIYAIALDGIQQTFQISGAAALVPDQNGVPRYHTSIGISDTYKQAVEEYLKTHQLNERKIVISNAKEQPGVLFLDALRDIEGICASASFPLQYQDQYLGKIIVYYNTPHKFTAEEIQLAETIAAYVATAITRKQGEDALQQTNERLAITNAELARATRLKDEFLANMSHELRTPLNAILGLSEGLVDEAFGSLNDRQKKSIATIERSGKHLLELINDILDLAKIEAGKIELQINSVSAKHLCESSLTFVKQLALKKRIQLKTEISQEIDSLLGDERRLRQALINLLSNAVKFTNEGGTVTLEATFEQSQEHIRFSVIDTGIGIAQDDIHKLFQSFVQIDSRLNRHYTGTGLGLVLARRIVELHGGTIDVESVLGQGSRFTISLPWHCHSAIPQPNRSRALAMTQLHSTSEAATLLSQPLILLAEDNETNTDMLFEYLCHRGYRVITANNGVAAIEQAKHHQPNLILMDIQMPEMDGLTAIEYIRKAPKLSEVPIIALTALAMPTDQERCLAAGANDYMAKPMILKELVILIQQLLQEK